GVAQAVHRQALLLLRAHDGHVNLGVLQVARHLRPGHGHALDAGVAQLEQDRLAGDLADGLGYPCQTVCLHATFSRDLRDGEAPAEPGGSRLGRSLALPSQTSISWSSNSATGWTRRAATICSNAAFTWLASLPTIASPRTASWRWSSASTSAIEMLNSFR